MIRLCLVFAALALAAGCITLSSSVEPDIEPTHPGLAASPRTNPPATEPAEQSVIEPTVISESRPSYTDDAKRNAVEAKVLLKVKLDERGLVQHVEVLDGPGYGLNRAAADAIRRFRFRPAYKLDGTTVPFVFVYTFTFSLD